VIYWQKSWCHQLWGKWGEFKKNGRYKKKISQYITYLTMFNWALDLFYILTVLFSSQKIRALLFRLPISPRSPKYTSKSYLLDIQFIFKHTFGG